MSIAIWPEELPQYTMMDGYSKGVPDGRLITKADSGPPKVRRTTTAAGMPVNLAIIVDIDGQGIFDNFWKETLNFGVRPFLIRNPHFNNTALATPGGLALTDNNDVIIVIDSWWLCLFADAPQRSARSHNLTQISLSLSILRGGHAS